MNKKTSRILVLTLLCLVAVGMGVIAYAATATFMQPDPLENVDISGAHNPDDDTPYITVYDDDGLIHYEQTVSTGDQSVFLGTIRANLGDGYMYVYGYYYTGSAPINTSNLNGWKMQGSSGDEGWTADTMGWGCAVIDKNQTSYADPAGVIEGQRVTRMDNCYNGCKRLTTSADKQWQLPRIPATVKRTDSMFANCTGLQRACLTTASTLTKNTFSGCTALKQIFLGQNVTTVKANTFAGVPSDCKLYLDVDAASKPSTFANGWSNGIATSAIKYNADILIWATTENY